MDSARIAEHLAQWEHNRAYLQSIPAEYPDWQVTACLYVTIHAIEALLTADGAKARSRHQDRLQILQAEKRYERIYEAFHVLYNLAHVTRYSARPGRWTPRAKIEGEVVKRLVYPIENSVRKLLAAAKPPVIMPAMPDIVLK